eukprot:3520035-Prymnesium_polylepis.1
MNASRVVGAVGSQACALPPCEGLARRDGNGRFAGFARWSGALGGGGSASGELHRRQRRQSDAPFGGQFRTE